MNEVLVGHAKEVLASLSEKSIQCCVTSPPYYGLRSYGLGGVIWGGDKDCEHIWGEKNPPLHKGQVKQTKWKLANGIEKAGNKETGRFCCKCGAWYGNLGLEPTPELYVEHLVEILRGVKRVLRDDGVLWLNLGDSYYNYRPGKGQKQVQQTIANSKRDLPDESGKRGNKIENLKEKDLIGIPWMVAFALRDDGWYLRQDITWAKKNCMPESVKDRCTKSHEYIFLLTKSSHYFFDNEAIREPCIEKGRPSKSKKRNKRSVWWVGTKPCRWDFCRNCQSLYEGKDRRAINKIDGEKVCPKCKSHEHWVKHFAMFPDDLIDSCILSGTSAQGCCEKCSAPWERIMKNNVTIGWEPSCDCDTSIAPCKVLDPFCGAGTTGTVSASHGLDFVGIDLNEAYAEVARARIKKVINNE